MLAITQFYRADERRNWILAKMSTYTVNFKVDLKIRNERKSEKAHIPHAPTLLENAVYNEWKFQALVTGNRTENQFHLSCTK